MIRFLKTKYNATFYIFPQVINRSQFGDEDLKLAKKIYAELDSDLKDCVQLIEGNFESIDLAKTYGQMDFFIATRLHSSIFSVNQNVPIVNISYHGTKSEGTFELLNYSENVIRITEITPDLLISKSVEVIKSLELIAKKLDISMKKIKNDIDLAFNNLVK